MRRDFASRLLRLASHERGAVFWVPGLLLATYLVLFGISKAPGGFSLFTHTTGLRIVIGPWESGPGTEAECATLVAALRRGLARHGDLSLVDSLRVAQRLAADPTAANGAGDFLHAIRPLNPHIGIRGTLNRGPAALEAHLEAWDVHARRRMLEVSVRGAHGEGLGRALAESLQASVFVPRRVAAATR